MNPLKNIPWILIISLWSSLAQAQNYIDLGKFSYGLTPQSNFEGNSDNTALQEVNGDLTIPIVIHDSLAFLTGINYETVTASFNPRRAQESFTGLTLKLGANVKHNAKWSGTYVFLPQISSDFKDISNRDFQFGGVILMKYVKSKHFNYRFGVYGNSDLFGPFFVPLFGFYYLSPSEKFETTILLPLALDANYAIDQNLRLGLNFKGQVKTFNVNTPLGTETDRYLTKSAKDLYLYFRYSMNRGLNLQVSVGRSLGRHYRMYNETISFGLPLVTFGDDRTQLNSDFSDSWLFKLGIFYRLNLE